jgi:MFS family permease
MGRSTDGLGEALMENVMAPPRRPAHAGAVLRAVAIVSLLPFVFGYSLGFTSPALAGLTHELGLGPTARAAFSAVVNVGAMGMAAGAGQLTDQWGRRTVIAAMAAIGLLGWLLVGSATNVRALFAGRVLTGASAGGASVAVNIYVAEVAPPELRGALGAAFQVAVTVGILATYALGVGLHWRALALCGAAPCALLLLSLPWLPETPQWLLIARGDAAGARAALRRLRARDDAGLADELAALDAVAPAACAKCARESRPDDASASAPQYEPPQPGSGGAAVDAVDGDARAQPARLELAGAAPGGDGYAGAAVCEAGSAVPDTDGGEAEMALAAEATHAAVAASEGALEARATLSGIELWVLRPLLLSIVLMVFQQFSGINAGAQCCTHIRLVQRAWCGRLARSHLTETLLDSTRPPVVLCDPSRPSRHIAAPRAHPVSSTHPSAALNQS